MPRFRCVSLPYRPPSPEEEPKAGLDAPGEDEKTTPRVYSSVFEAQRELRRSRPNLLPEVTGTLEWAEEFHFPRPTPPVGRGLLRHVPTAHDSAPRRGGAPAKRKNAREPGNARGGDAWPSRGTPARRPTRRVQFVDLSRVDDETPVIIDASSSSSSEVDLENIKHTESEGESSEGTSSEEYEDEPRWGRDEDATWHPAVEGRKRPKGKKFGAAKRTVKTTARRTKKRRAEKTLSGGPSKHAHDDRVDRFLFRRGAARALGRGTPRLIPRSIEADNERSGSRGSGDADDDTDGDDDDCVSFPPSVSGDGDTDDGDSFSSSSSSSSSSSAPGLGLTSADIRRINLEKAG